MIVGTAGHIDHGKSALVQALTGRPMDPLAEERRRGITLDLHFAPLESADGTVAGVVDVPGHEDLVRAMVAGAAGLDLVLLVVAADEGIMPQTREHLAILEQLRIPAGIPVITKADLVESEWLQMVQGEVDRWLAGSSVSFSPAVPVSVRTGDGMDGLRARLADALRAAPPRGRDQDLLRLPVDRAFSLAGAGTVVTGTLWSGRLSVGDQVSLLPGGHAGRVRSLERHGRPIDRATPGERIAVALAGVEREVVRRGAMLVLASEPLLPTHALDVEVRLLATASRPLTTRTRVRVHLGTAEVLARVRTREVIPPGGSGLARLALEEPVVARGGDRLVIRSYSPVTTIGGAMVVDPLPSGGRVHWDPRLGSPDLVSRLAGLVDRRGDGVPTALLPVLSGLPPEEARRLRGRPGFIEVGSHLLLESRVQVAGQRLEQLLAAFHRDHPAEPGIPLETLRAGQGRAGQAALDRLVAAGTVVNRDGVVREARWRPQVAGGDAALERLIQRIEDANLTPPSLAELEAELGLPGTADAARLAARSGRITAVERDRYYGQRALSGFTARLAQLASRGPITPPAAREALGISRKYLIPLLEWADRSGLTVRDGDVRRAGPRLPPSGGTDRDPAGPQAGG